MRGWLSRDYFARQVLRLCLLCSMCAMPSGFAAERPSLQIINGSEQPIEVFWAPAGMDRVSNGRLQPD
ncbi:MAG: hypothetical protein MUF23_15030 [Pirellula sp.]|nr:hypothetical protein [Pirellula sp.]